MYFSERDIYKCKIQMSKKYWNLAEIITKATWNQLVLFSTKGTYLNGQDADELELRIVRRLIFREKS